MTADKFKERLVFYRDSFTNEIPTELVHSTSPKVEGKGWKVRKGWFTQLAFLLELAILDKLIPKAILKDVKSEVKFVRSKQFNSRLTNAEDIEGMDKCINLVLQALD